MDKDKNNDKENFAVPSIDNYSSRKEWEDACWHKIIKSEDILRTLITSYERRNLIMRAAVMERVDAGKNYQQISEELWLSPQTISSIKKALKESSYRSYRERGKTERKKRVYSSAPTSTQKNPRDRSVRIRYGTIRLPRRLPR